MLNGGATDLSVRCEQRGCPGFVAHLNPAGIDQTLLGPGNGLQDVQGPEITAVPEVACAAPEDIRDSAARLREILEVYQ